MCMCKILVNVFKCNYGEIAPKKSHLKVPGGVKKPANSHSLTIFSSTVRLREVILALWTLKWASASAYERCRLLVKKLPGQQFGGRLWEVSAYSRCPLAEVRL